MKITFVLPAYMWKPAGGYRVVYEYANQLVVRGHEVSVVHPRFLRSDYLPPSNPYQWLRWKARCLRNLLIKPNVSWWQPINKQVKMLYVPEPTVQHVPDSDAIFATAWQTTEYVAEYPANKGVKFYLVMDFDHYMGSQEKLEASWKLPFKKVTISQWLYENVESMTGAQDTINIPLGIELNRFQKIEDVHNRSKRIAMMYSFYSKYKAVDDGIQALKICKDKYPDLQVTIFGNYRTPKIPSWVDYRYNVSDAELINIYNQSRIFICSSLAEGFAFPPAEAMACGCAVVSTDCGGNREYAIDGATALLSPPNDPGALAKNVINLLEDDDLRIKLAKAGHEYIQQFTWERSTNLLEQFIMKNIKSKARSEKRDGISQRV